MNRPFTPRNSGSSASFVRINGKIRATEVRVIGVEGDQLGVLSLRDALNLARTHAVDLVEIVPTAVPPVCRLVDFGKYRYEQNKKEKDSKKHHHANKVKEIQLSATIDPHDFGVKLQHAIDFLSDEMKVKVTLRFRGREMAHKEFGFEQVQKFIKDVAPWGQPDAPPKLIGKGLNVMLSPLPRNKRAKNPKDVETEGMPEKKTPAAGAPSPEKSKAAKQIPTNAAETAFANNPFAQIDAAKLNP